ncbi:MAG: cbb3-type cytochrome oxidase assembly protein CcoS [Gammaproteobacteria bacterium]|nr:MAG: cbb3-type cytochrome oxidase assembly protein CcoS [Gammaproteobacteria bacterium]
MDVIYFLIPAMLIIGLLIVIVLIISIKNGQYDDLDGDSYRILMEDEDGDGSNKNQKI